MGSSYSILGDSPVDASRDRLNFGKFVTPFAERLIQSVDNTPFTVGILADWGQGKSTVMQMLKTSLETQGCATAWFEPWKYTGREAVWKGLALTLVREINANDSLRKELSRKKDGLQTFAAKALWSRLIGREWAQDLVDTVKSEPWSPSLLHDFEQNFEVLFEHIDPARNGGAAKPFVLFVDDLDRCLPESALAVLEALKLVLNRPGLITVMGIAQRELSRAVAAAYARETKDAGGVFDPKWGDNYMEKVIQMPFPLPVISDASLEAYVGTCLADSGIEPGLESDPRWRAIIREACGGNLRQVKRFLNHLIAEMDKADANEGDAGQAQAQDLDARRVAFTLLLGWRFPEFLMLIRKQVADRELLIRYQLYFSQQASGTAGDASLLQDPDGKFHKDPALASFFAQSFGSTDQQTALVVPFSTWEGLQPYLQFGLRTGQQPAASPRQAPAPQAQTAQAAPTAATAPVASSVGFGPDGVRDQVIGAPDMPPSGADHPGPPPSRQAPAPSAPDSPAVGQPSEHLVEIIGRVQSLMASRRFDEAMRETEAGLSVARTVQDYPAQAVLLNARGELFDAQGKTAEAESTLEQAQAMARQSQSPILRTALLNLARMARHTGKHPYALSLASEAVDIAVNAGDTIGELIARTELADAREAEGNLTQAEIDYRQLLALTERSQNRQGQLMVLERLARLLARQGRENVELLGRADLLANALGDRRARARIHFEALIQRLGENPEFYRERAERTAFEFLASTRELLRDEADVDALRTHIRSRWWVEGSGDVQSFVNRHVLPGLKHA